jgi:two-component system, LytTR family, response regulator
MIRVLIADDEPLARRGTRAVLSREPDIEIVAECETGEEAVREIRARRPDLVFLDIEMPAGNGFQVLEALPADEMPVVVFITAHDRHALEAFETHAIDYLLKPVDPERFAIALERARAAVSYKEREQWPRRLAALLHDMKSPPRYRSRLMVRGAGRVLLVPVTDIDWIEAASNYARLHLGTKIHLLRETLGNLEAELDPDRFCRIHRSTIVNLERIKEIVPEARGDQVLVLHDGTRLDLSARHRETLEERLGRPR